jgi:hypothetical protein
MLSSKSESPAGQPSVAAWSDRAVSSSVIRCDWRSARHSSMLKRRSSQPIWAMTLCARSLANSAPGSSRLKTRIPIPGGNCEMAVASTESTTFDLQSCQLSKTSSVSRASPANAMRKNRRAKPPISPECSGVSRGRRCFRGLSAPSACLRKWKNDDTSASPGSIWYQMERVRRASR